MLISVQWLNRYLDPGDLSPDEAVRVLESTSFPIESREDRADGDAILDVEVTSNRGDCLCHLGLAREVAAATGRGLKTPSPGLGSAGSGAAGLTSVENRVEGVCPRFTVRVIRGVKVGPSPGWLVDALERVGQRSISNVVDVSNYVLLELGHPSHAFDMATLAEGRLVVRRASAGEELTVLDGKRHRLRESDVVVADAERAVSLAGVIGGLETGVTATTTDVLLEMATWDPVTIRSTARRLGITTDAGYRFERYVDARDLEWASARCAELIVETAGGEIVDGMIDEGVALEARRRVEIRAGRCEHLLGKAIDSGEMSRLLGAVGFGVEVRGSGMEAVLACEVPHFRPDVTREVDLIEEVARLHGLDRLDVAPRLEVPLEIDHPEAWAAREHVESVIAETLVGSGFYETVTFSFATKREADLFMAPGTRGIRVDEDRRRETPYLRPSVVPSLLTVRRANQDGQVSLEGGVRLFEMASVFCESDDGEAHGRETRERRVLSLMMDAEPKAEGQQRALRRMRGVIEAMVERVAGRSATVVCREGGAAACAALAGASSAGVSVLRGGEESSVGWYALLGEGAVSAWGLDRRVVACELDLAGLIALHPAVNRVEGLAAFPSIERDLSVLVDEGVSWERVSSVVEGLGLAMLERVSFVGVFRGKPVEAGRKSVTLRLGFRSPDRTLRHEEVDPQVEAAVAALSREVGAELRS